MKMEGAKNSIGKMVMTTDPGNKMVKEMYPAHGPFRLLKITKAGLAILEGYEGRVSVSTIEVIK